MTPMFIALVLLTILTALFARRETVRMDAYYAESEATPYGYELRRIIWAREARVAQWWAVGWAFMTCLMGLVAYLVGMSILFPR